MRLDNFAILARGGVGKPFYALWEGGDRIDLQREYPRTLRWEVGLTFVLPLDL